MKNVLRSVLIPLAAALAIVGCGKKGDPGATSSASATQSTSGAASNKAASDAPASGRAIEITGNDQMKFSIAEIRAKPGEALSVTLKNVGTIPKFSMGHNFVVLKKPELIEGFIQEATMAAAKDYIPDSRKADVIAHTKLLGPKEQDTVTFKAPAERGRYPFLCSFPGHYQVGMKGELIVE